jgi:hypothetical protein
VQAMPQLDMPKSLVAQAFASQHLDRVQQT